jgi:hypothetical protein
LEKPGNGGENRGANIVFVEQRQKIPLHLSRVRPREQHFFGYAILAASIGHKTTHARSLADLINNDQIDEARSPGRQDGRVARQKPGQFRLCLVFAVP